MMSASDHAPIGIMGDMHHSKFMLSLRQEYMHMNGNLLDGKDIREQAIINLPNTVSNMPANLSVVPKEMNMQMTMLGGMYSPSDNITLMAIKVILSDGEYIPPNIVICMFISLGTTDRFAGMFETVLGKFMIACSLISFPSSRLPFICIYSCLKESINLL